jgi:hypothetical protein
MRLNARGSGVVEELEWGREQGAMGDGEGKKKLTEGLLCALRGGAA